MAILKNYFGQLFPGSVAPATPDQAASQQAAQTAPTPTNGAAPAAPVAAGAARPAIQTTASAVDIVAQMRRDAAAEQNRQNEIRRFCSGDNAGLEIDVTEGGQRRRVNLMAHAIAAGWSAEQTELQAHRTIRAQNTPFGYVRSGTPAVTAQTIEAALCKTLKIADVEKQFTPQVLEAADRQFKTIGLQQILIMAAAGNGYQVGTGEKITSGNIRNVLKHAFPASIQAGWTTLSVPGIFSNVANKEILQGYMQEDQTWQEICGVKSVTDFKQITSYRLLDSLEYEKIGPGGEIKGGKVGEESYTRQVATYAKMLGITRVDIINDDLGAFDDLRARLGRGAAQKLNNVVWSVFLNPSSSTYNGSSVAFWSSTRTNYITGSTTNLAADGVGLGLAVKAFRQMVSSPEDGAKRIGGRPEILLVPPELEQIADTLYRASNLQTVKASDANTFTNKYRPVVSPWLSDSNFTGYSTTAWWLLRSPSIAPPIVVSFLNGNQTPIIEDAEADFSVLGIQFRGYHDFGADQAEYLAGIKSKGAA
jgi:hypothetical protein